MRAPAILLPFAALTLAVLGAHGAAAQAPVELKISHYVPAVHPVQTEFLEPWARDVERRSNNQVKFTIFPGGTSFGDVAKQYDQVTAGVIDIALGLHGIPRGRFPRTSVIELPFLTESADAATRTLWALYPRYLQEEYRQVKVLGLFAHNGGLIHTRDKQVTQLADLKGLRIRTPSPAVSMMLEYLGATPVGMPPGQVYENLQKGAIDGTVFPWDPVASFKLAEVLKYHLDARSYTVSFYFVMNSRKYEALPAAVKQAIDSTTGDAMVARFGPWWNKWDQAGLDQAKARGNVIVRLSDAERERWRQTLTPMTQAYLADIEKQGAKNARDIYDEARKLIAQYEKKS
jgi:TRAP-type transport system periplasmic protein